MERYYRIPEAVLYLLGRRYYQPPMGRFISEDPICRPAVQPEEHIRSDALMGHNCQTLSWHVYVRNGPTVLADPTGEYYRDKSCDSNATWRSLLSTGMKSIRMGTLKTFLCCLENRGAISSATKQTWTQAFNWKTTGPTIYCGDDAYCKLLGAVGTGVACGYPPNMKDVRLCNPALNPYGSIGQYACDWPNVECCILHETVHIFMGLPGHANAAVKQCWPYQRCPKGGAAWT